MARKSRLQLGESPPGSRCAGSLEKQVRPSSRGLKMTSVEGDRLETLKDFLCSLM
jgi:hypothetical protein